MGAFRLRRTFLQPFVITVAACGKSPPPVSPPVSPSPTPATVTPDAAEPATAVTPDAAAPVATADELKEPVLRNPPPPEPEATRNLRWRLERTGTTLETAKCTAQQIEPCQKAKPPCAPPKRETLCVYEDSSLELAQHRKYPLVVEQKKGSPHCFVAGTKPPERTYCPDQWDPESK